MANESVGGRVSTGIDGLDEVLHGGLVPGRSYMVSGAAGTGKTVLGLEFLLAGVEHGETSLFVGFEESSEDVIDNAASLGMDLSGIELVDLSPGSDFFVEEQSYDVFAPAEVETGGLVERITEAVEETDPDRIVVDPLTRLRMLADDDFLFRKTVQSFLRYLTERGATVLFTTQPVSETSVEEMEFLSDGNVRLGRAEKGRTVEVTKFRGSDFAGGEHTLRITGAGIEVYPELVPGDHRRTVDGETIGSGVPELDAQLHGGIERGTVTVLAGPSGVGKTTVGTHFLKEAASRDERSVIYLFEEDTATFDRRSEAVGVPIGEMRESGTLATEEVEPLAVSADEFAHRVRTEVERRDAEVVMIDGTAGYRLSIRGGEGAVLRELHALCRYLRNMGVTVILIEEIDTVTGSFQPTQHNISYLADNIVVLRYVEIDGEIRKTIGVLKKRTSDFQRTLRELSITGDGVHVGEPLRGLQGILTGTPSWPDDDPD